MAQCGVASRRKCEEIILQGRVKVNGKTVNQLGFKVDPEKDVVEVDGKRISLQMQKVYIMLNNLLVLFLLQRMKREEKQWLIW